MKEVNRPGRVVRWVTFDMFWWRQRAAGKAIRPDSAGGGLGPGGAGGGGGPGCDGDHSAALAGRSVGRCSSGAQRSCGAWYAFTGPNGRSNVLPVGRRYARRVLCCGRCGHKRTQLFHECVVLGFVG